VHSPEPQPRVAIVLCTFNGAKHIQAQLDSLATQIWPIAVRVFDDASTDATVTLLKQYENKLDLKVHVNQKNIGYVTNFESGIAQVIDEGFDYVALCDQDDLWNAERTAKGMQAVQSIENQFGPAAACLAHSDLRMIDSNNQCVHPSFFKYRDYDISSKRDLATVLGQNGVMGNTILMNRALAELALPFPDALHVHDYWLAVLAELHGHRVLVNEALVDYRIHDANASNSTSDIKFGVSRLLDKKSWNGFVQRDFRLPFKEDFRLNVIDALLNESSKFPKPDGSQVRLLTTFRDYLKFKGSRTRMLVSMLKAGFFRKNLKHRIRLIFSTLLTTRYTN